MAFESMMTGHFVVARTALQATAGRGAIAATLRR